ncbi:MAG: sigma-54 dependent transcriptional regulator [Pseudomonadota bacterium]
MKADILVIDDEEDIREIVSGILEDEGYATRTASGSESALNAIAERVPRLIFLDIWLQGSKLDGLELLEEIQSMHPGLPVVMISGHGNIETAVSAIKNGAYDYIEKPFKADRLVLVADRALETSALKQEVNELKQQTVDSAELVGNSLAMNTLRQAIARVSPTNSRVLINGPIGCGKGMVAKSIHESSPRANGPFVMINAATITPSRMEVELFGTEANGSERKIGALEKAHGGILYIDEVADMPLETQAKILRVLVEQEFERVGGVRRVKVDVRTICSTAADLEALAEEGKFRRDLLNRIAVVPIDVPALSQRREDIPALIQSFMKQISQQTGIKSKIIDNDAMAVLQAHRWPGNVRQLRNNIERLMILTRDDPDEVSITAEKLPAELNDDLPKAPSQDGAHIMSLPLREAREKFEREYLMAQINRFGGNISKTAEFIGMERSALHRKLKSLGV